MYTFSLVFTVHWKTFCHRHPIPTVEFEVVVVFVDRLHSENKKVSRVDKSHEIISSYILKPICCVGTTNK